LAAYETLACSVALPKSGRNKELALHILAENRGNLQAAVMDLLRCDTLDWEQYPAIYNSRYVDVDNWSPEEIASFQVKKDNNFSLQNLFFLKKGCNI